MDQIRNILIKGLADLNPGNQIDKERSEKFKRIIFALAELFRGLSESEIQIVLSAAKELNSPSGVQEDVKCEDVKTHRQGQLIINEMKSDSVNFAGLRARVQRVIRPLFFRGFY